MPKAYTPYSEERRSKLFDRIADGTLKELARRLRAPEICPHCHSKGIVASEISALVLFLKQNAFKVSPSKPQTNGRTLDALDLIIAEQKRERLKKTEEEEGKE